MNPGLSYVRLTTSYIRYRAENYVIPTHHMTHSKCRRPPGQWWLATTLRWAMSLYFKFRKNIFCFFKWKLIVGPGHNISYHTTAQLPVHVRNHDLICDKKNVYYNHFFLQDYDLELWNPSKTKIPITIGKGTDAANPYQKPRTRGNKFNM